MGLTSPLYSVKGYSVSKPPVTIFVICLILCASATLAMGFFIQYAEAVLNPEVKGVELLSAVKIYPTVVFYCLVLFLIYGIFSD